jgi:hypothetical protein
MGRKTQTGRKIFLRNFNHWWSSIFYFFQIRQKPDILTLFLMSYGRTDRWSEKRTCPYENRTYGNTGYKIVFKATKFQHDFSYNYFEQSSKYKIDFFVFRNTSPIFSKMRFHVLICQVSSFFRYFRRFGGFNLILVRVYPIWKFII